MPTVHRTLNGQWVECAEGTCDLKFHFPNTSVAEMKSMPMQALLPLLEVLDPPTNNILGTKVWVEENVWDKTTDVWVPHREYDLPAAVYENGDLEWMQRGVAHRDGDKPARVNMDGTQIWYRWGQLHREGAPAYIKANGEVEWFLNDEDVDEVGNLLYPIPDELMDIGEDNA